MMYPHISDCNIYILIVLLTVHVITLINYNINNNKSGTVLYNVVDGIKVVKLDNDKKLDLRDDNDRYLWLEDVTS